MQLATPGRLRLRRSPIVQFSNGLLGCFKPLDTSLHSPKLPSFLIRSSSSDTLLQLALDGIGRVAGSYGLAVHTRYRVD